MEQKMNELNIMHRQIQNIMFKTNENMKERMNMLNMVKKQKPLSNGFGVITKCKTPSNNKVTLLKVFMYVPFNYKNEAKQEGFKWDNDKKGWYVMSNNPNLEQLKEKWNSECFRCDFYGSHRSYNSTKDIIRPEPYDEKKHHNPIWYSVNILGHE
jgi:hypothetical protein